MLNTIHGWLKEYNKYRQQKVLISALNAYDRKMLDSYTTDFLIENAYDMDEQYSEGYSRMRLHAELLSRGVLTDNLWPSERLFLFRWWCDCQKNNIYYDDIYQQLNDSLNQTFPHVGALYTNQLLSVDEWCDVIINFDECYRCLYETKRNYIDIFKRDDSAFVKETLFSEKDRTNAYHFILAVFTMLFKQHGDHWRDVLDNEDCWVCVDAELHHLHALFPDDEEIQIMTDFWINPESTYRALADVAPSILIFKAPDYSSQEVAIFQ